MPTRVRGGDDFVAMMSNGASGDINNLPFLLARPPREPGEQVRIVASKAADAAWHAWKKIENYAATEIIPKKLCKQLLSLERDVRKAVQAGEAARLDDFIVGPGDTEKYLGEMGEHE